MTTETIIEANETVDALTEQAVTEAVPVVAKKTNRGSHMRSYSMSSIQSFDPLAMDAIDKAFRRLLGDDFNEQNCRLMLTDYLTWLGDEEARARQAAIAKIKALAEASGVDLSTLLPTPEEKPVKAAKAPKA